MSKIAPIKKFKFTSTKLLALPSNDKDSKSTDLEFTDTEVQGLKCLSGKNGSKRFLFRYCYQGRKGSIAVGHFPDVDLATARKVARQHRNLLAGGIDPKAKRDVVSTFPTVYDFFWNTYLPLAKKHKRTWSDDVSRFKFHCKPLFSISSSKPKKVYGSSFHDLAHT